MTIRADNYFADYDAFTENELRDITPKGILLRNNVWIDFAVCAKNYKETHNLEKDTSCIGEIDASDLSFTFYASPKPIMIAFIEKNKVVEFFLNNNAHKRFCDLQKKISEYGYRTFDMS